MHGVLQVAWGALVERLHPLAHIRLESQVRLYARARLVDVTSQRAALGVTVPPKALPFFVDTDAWSLEHGRMVAGHAHPLSADPHGIPESILHFVGYMPASEERPMRIQCSRGECAGFKIADWGGVTLLNSRHVQSDLPLFLGTSIQQFRELLGLAAAGNWVVAAPRGVAGNRSQGRRSHHVRGGLGAVAVLSPEGDGVALWEVDWLMRHRYLQLLHETSSAVAALLDLVRSLPLPVLPEAHSPLVAWFPPVMMWSSRARVFPCSMSQGQTQMGTSHRTRSQPARRRKYGLPCWRALLCLL